MLVLRCVGGNAVCVLMYLFPTCAALALRFAAYGGSAVCIGARQYAPVEGPSRMDVTARVHLRKSDNLASSICMCHFCFWLTPAVVTSPVLDLLVRPARGEGRGQQNQLGKWANNPAKSRRHLTVRVACSAPVCGVRNWAPLSARKSNQ